MTNTPLRPLINKKRADESPSYGIDVNLERLAAKNPRR
jgi:hypothetical protein